MMERHKGTRNLPRRIGQSGEDASSDFKIKLISQITPKNVKNPKIFCADYQKAGDNIRYVYSGLGKDIYFNTFNLNKSVEKKYILPAGWGFGDSNSKSYMKTFPFVMKWQNLNSTGERGKVLFGCIDGQLRLYDDPIEACKHGKSIVEQYKELYSLHAHNGLIWGVDFLPWDRSSIVSCGLDLTIQVHDLNSSSSIPKKLILGHEDCIKAICVSEKSPNLIASCSLDKKLKLWDLRQNQQVNNGVEDFLAPLNSISFNSDGKKIIYGDEKGEIGIYDLSNMASIETQVIVYPENEDEEVGKPVFHKRGNGKPPSDRNKGPIESVCFTDGGKALVASNDNDMFFIKKPGKGDDNATNFSDEDPIPINKARPKSDYRFQNRIRGLVSDAECKSFLAFSEKKLMHYRLKVKNKKIISEH